MRLKRYRIIEVDYTNDKVPHSNYKRYIIQKRFLFWWYDMAKQFKCGKKTTKLNIG